MLFAQPRVLAEITGNPEHPAVKESLEAVDFLLKEIRECGYRKGKYIYLCSFGTFTDLPDYKPDLDFILVTLTMKEVRNLKLDEKRWDEIVSKIKKRLPKAKILAIIDWGGTTNTSLGVFSQELSKEEQKEFLKIADDFFQKKGVIFIYPVHGGFMGQDAKILSYGKSKTYDSLAPEFETYETVKQLTQNKSEGNPMICIGKPGNYLYIFDREIISLKMPIILGEITVVAEAYDEDGISKVEFYIDDIIRFTDHDTPYSWLWDEFAIGKYEIRTIAYDREGNEAESEMGIFIFNLGNKKG